MAQVSTSKLCPLCIFRTDICSAALSRAVQCSRDRLCGARAGRAWMRGAVGGDGSGALPEDNRIGLRLGSPC